MFGYWENERKKYIIIDRAGEGFRRATLDDYTKEPVESYSFLGATSSC